LLTSDLVPFENGALKTGTVWRFFEAQKCFQHEIFEAGSVLVLE